MYFFLSSPFKTLLFKAMCSFCPTICFIYCRATWRLEGFTLFVLSAGANRIPGVGARSQDMAWIGTHLIDGTIQI
ncbi:hypothetical protein L228DRAFT_59890 [Xylona heveae TC161]|uniref:Uncharacterized protein n=1 Tax=Xylona heveae (strain CBS 132557 / TC161) TaxID=1328760 RepID=A0A165IJW0_XYLHT|nr:hypothetical protein L228DRAFT_59890 [Xylona heveae TC161]KZF24995.1 hypothetical protein L228DRAFT_59890 [Xylona heveae TC161]